MEHPNYPAIMQTGSCTGSKSFICILFALNSFSVIAQQPQIVPFDTGSRKEILYDKTPVSGEIKVGLMYVTTEDIVVPNYFYAKMPHKNIEGKKLCTIISSNDGLYKGEVIHTLRKEFEGKTMTFQWESVYMDKLKKYHRNEFAILSGIATDCNKPIETFVIVDWTAKHSNEFAFIINSDKKPRISVKKATEQKIFECEKIEGTQNVTFNYRCQLSLADIEMASSIYVQQKIKKLSAFTITEYAFPVSY